MNEKEILKALKEIHNSVKKLKKDVSEIKDFDIEFFFSTTLYKDENPKFSIQNHNFVNFENIDFYKNQISSISLLYEERNKYSDLENLPEFIVRYTANIPRVILESAISSDGFVSKVGLIRDDTYLVYETKLGKEGELFFKIKKTNGDKYDEWYESYLFSPIDYSLLN